MAARNRTKPTGVNLPEGDVPPAAKEPRVVRRRRPSTPPESSGSPMAVDDILAEMGDKAARLSDEGLSIHVPGVIKSGSEYLDWGLGRGGWPLARMVLVGGDEGSGKTSLALQAIANCQRMGGVAAFIDAEFKLDLAYAANLGVDVKRLIMPPPLDPDDPAAEPLSVERSFDWAEEVVAAYLRSPASRTVPFFLAYDSIGALMTEQELDDKDALGMNARAISSSLKKLNPWVSRSAMCFMMLSQLRAKVNVTYGPKETTMGGKAPRFYSALIVHLDVIGGVKEGANKDRVGNRVRANVVKNQVAPPYRDPEFTVMFGKGVDHVESIHTMLVDRDLAVTKGSWTTFPVEDGEPIKWQGARDLRLLEAAHPEKFAKLLAACRNYPGYVDGMISREG